MYHGERARNGARLSQARKVRSVVKHNDIRHKLSEYIDGSASDTEKAEIEKHVRDCPACSDALRELRKTVEHIKNS